MAHAVSVAAQFGLSSQTPLKQILSLGHGRSAAQVSKGVTGSGAQDEQPLRLIMQAMKAKIPNRLF